MTRTIFIAATLALATTLPAAPAYAAAPRTFLSAAGSDSNSCTNVATPCRHLAAAFAATASDGEIYVLDPANYGSLTITHGVSIEGHGWASIAPVSGGNAITINANSGDKINIIGVVLDGTALSGVTGIQFNSGGNLTVRDSVIRNFTVAGLLFAPTAVSALLVSHTLVSDSTYGIRVLPTGPTASAQVTLSEDEISNNGTGFSADPVLCACNGGTPVDAAIINTVVANNSNIGVLANGDPGSSAIGITGSSIVYNGTGLYANGDSNDGSIITIGLSTIRGNNFNLKVCILYCQINSFGNNMVLPHGTASNTVPLE